MYKTTHKNIHLACTVYTNRLVFLKETATDLASVRPVGWLKSMYSHVKKYYFALGNIEKILKG
jgi:hypothetical protein